MAEKTKDNIKTLELWDGFTVEFNTQLSDDFDFITDLSEAINESDLSTMVEMYMALIGGAKVYDKIKDHIIEEEGYFSQKSVMNILKKIDDSLPKSGNREQRRTGRNSI